MKLRYFKAKRWLLVVLLGFVGTTVSSCEEKGKEPVEMYGTPPTEFNDSITNR